MKYKKNIGIVIVGVLIGGSLLYNGIMYLDWLQIILGIVILGIPLAKIDVTDKNPFEDKKQLAKLLFESKKKEIKEKKNEST